MRKFTYMPYFFLVGLIYFLLCPFSARAYSTALDEGLTAILGEEKPLLRITYTAGTKGELYPCVTCGTNALGGLARRATVLDQLQEDFPHIHIAGAEEFLSDLDLMRFARPDWNPADPIIKHNETEKARRLAKGHSLLPVTIGYLMPEEEEWLRTFAGKHPKGFITVHDKPVSKILELPTGKVGIVLFPKGTDNNQAPSPQQLNAVINAGKALRNKVNLVIGVSPWGNVAEYRFLRNATGVYHLLFGGGGGLGAPYEPEHSTEKLLWIRSESHGRAVNSLDILEMPRPGQDANWVEGLSFNAAQVFLYLKLPPKPAMEQAIGTTAASWLQERN